MNKKGFSLIELIVVISIIAILSVLGINTYNSIQVDARNSKRKSDLKEIQNALEIYRSEKKTYPSTVDRSGCRTTTRSDDGNWCGLCATYNTNNTFNNVDNDNDSDDPGTDSDDTGYIPDLAPGFMQQLPIDPRNSLPNSSSSNTNCSNNEGLNCYLYNSNGAEYKLIAHCTPEGTLEEEDPFYDPVRPTHAWQVSSSSNAQQW